MRTTLDELEAFIGELCDTAEESAQGISLSANSTDLQESLKYERQKRVKASLDHYPKHKNLRIGGANEVWTAVVFADLRNSSNRAIEVGARHTFITMHCLIGGLAYLIQEEEGCVANFRGDGLFGLFGLDEDGENPDDMDAGQVTKRAALCGIGMLEMVQTVVNPTLNKRKIKGDLRIGVGVDTGRVVITRIGLPNTNELTAYGPPVNKAAKLCSGNHSVHVSERVEDTYPVGKEGKMKFTEKKIKCRNDEVIRGFRLDYPSDFTVLERSTLPRKNVVLK